MKPVGALLAFFAVCYGIVQAYRFLMMYQDNDPSDNPVVPWWLPVLAGGFVLLGLISIIVMLVGYWSIRLVWCGSP